MLDRRAAGGAIDCKAALHELDVSISNPEPRSWSLTNDES